MNIKGHTAIELKDVNTGKVERYEEDNMVTNALSKIFEPIGFYNNQGNMLDFAYTDGTNISFNEQGYLNPFHMVLTGGLLMFDTALAENPDNIYLPAGVSEVGSACYKYINNTLNKHVGSYNADESLIDLDNGIVRYVYDFTTQQANGTIASLGLTSRNAGLSGYGGEEYNIIMQQYHMSLSPYTGYNSNYPYTGDSNEKLLYMDYTNDQLVYGRFDGTSITILKRKGYMKSTDFFSHKLYTQKPELVESINISFSGTIPSDVSTNETIMYYDTDMSRLICIIPNWYYSINKCYVILVDIENEVTYEYYVDVSSQVNYGEGCFVYNGYLYIITEHYSQRLSHIYKIDLSNGSVVKDTTVDSFTFKNTYSPRFITVVNGKVYISYFYSSYGYYIIYDTVLDKVFYPAGQVFYSSNSSMLCKFIDKPWVIRERYGTGSTDVYYRYCIMGNYLATINNLATPVVKDVSKTMKVIYTLQKAS